MEEHSMPKIVIKPRLRPIGNNITDAFKLLIKHWAPLLLTQGINFVSTTIVIAISALVLAMPLLIAVFRGAADTVTTKILLAFAASVIFWVGLFIVLAVILLVGSWSNSTMMSALGHKGGRMAPIGASMKRGFTAMVPIFFLTLIVSLAYLGSSVMFFFPLIILMMGFSLAWYLVVLEGVPIFKAMATSWHITKGYKWSILGRVVLFVLMVFGIMMVFGVITIIPLMGIIILPLQLALNIIIVPYAFAYLYCIYEDIREVRKDVYSFKGGIAAFTIISWIVGVVACGGIIGSIVCLIQKYISS